MSLEPYVPKRPAQSRFVEARGLRHHLLEWGAGPLDTARPPLLMLHGWMDVAASFQFVVDAFAADRHVLALDWRGFGLSDTPKVDTYFFPEYLGDLEAVLEALLGAGHAPIDLLGHSMGGNVAMLYAGVRPDRIRRLVNLEGFGMPRSKPADSPLRIARWLDSLGKPEQLRPYPSLEAVADRLRKTNPLLRVDRAAWLAAQWSGPDGEGGARRLLADPTTSARARWWRRSTSGWRRGSGSRRRCCGSRATAPTSASGGATATRRPSFTSAWTASATCAGTSSRRRGTCSTTTVPRTSRG
jgi:pimeloyl-ACP methyl ester carboxylesterase